MKNSQLILSVAIVCGLVALALGDDASSSVSSGSGSTSSSSSSSSSAASSSARSSQSSALETQLAQVELASAAASAMASGSASASSRSGFSSSSVEKRAAALQRMGSIVGIIKCFSDVVQNIINFVFKIPESCCDLDFFKPICSEGSLDAILSGQMHCSAKRGRKPRTTRRSRITTESPEDDD